MKSNLGKFVALALGLGLATETFAEEWNVSTWESAALSLSISKS